MSNDDDHNNNTRGLPFPHSFNIGTTIQNVFRNINHAFTVNHDSSNGQHRDDDSRGHTDNVPPLEPLNLVAGTHDLHPTRTTHAPSSSPVPEPPISSASTPADVDMPSNSQPDSQRADDEDSMPELRSVSDSSDESEADIAAVDSVSSHQSAQPDRDNSQLDNEDDPPLLEPITGTRRGRVDDDVDDARDRRHPSERVGAPSPPGDAAPQGANPQQPPRHLAGLFGALFGQGPPGPNFFGGEAPPEQAQTGEDNADPSPTGNDATPGHAPRGVPILTAGFTLTIPLFGPPPGNHTGEPVGGQGQGAPPGLFNMDPATREELFASFAAFFQEFQALEEAREDPERAKKLVAGLEVVPLGLVKRLERVGGAPGGHAGDANSEGTSSGCAICWDTLLDGESDNFSSHQFSGGDALSSEAGVEGRDTTHAGRSDAMDVDTPSTSQSHSDAGTSASTPLPSEAAKIISLPCAHVFHASCLLPWFTRAKLATCPTCRFNIDPENLTYTPLPRRVFNRAPPAQSDVAAPDSAPAGPQAAPEAPATHLADGAMPPIDPMPATVHVPPATAAVPPGDAPSPPTGLAGGMPAGFNPFPAIPVLSIPAIQIPLRPPGAPAPGGGNQGIDVLTIGLDMFVGGLPPEERGADPRDNAEVVDGADNGGADTGAAGGNGAANPNGLAQDLHSLIEGLLRTTRNIIPQVINAQANAQGPMPPPAPGGLPADGDHPQPQAMPAPEAAEPGPQPVPPLAGGPRNVPMFPFRPMMFRPMRPMPPRQERKTWSLPPAPGPSLRQRVEQREREQGLRCSDTSCGVGPSDDDPHPEPSSSLTTQVYIYPLPNVDEHTSDVHASVCKHAFHPACLVSAERVAGWGGEDRAEPLVEVSCPVCRAVGCVRREEWESGVSAL